MRASVTIKSSKNKFKISCNIHKNEAINSYSKIYEIKLNLFMQYLLNIK